MPSPEGLGHGLSRGDFCEGPLLPGGSQSRDNCGQVETFSRAIPVGEGLAGVFGRFLGS